MTEYHLRCTCGATVVCAFDYGAVPMIYQPGDKWKGGNPACNHKDYACVGVNEDETGDSEPDAGLWDAEGGK